MTMETVALVSFFGGMAAGWRTWRDLVVDLQRHGLDNHSCIYEGCCR